MKVALLQLCSGDDPAKNLIETESMIRAAVESGADFILTPEVTNCVSLDRAHQMAVLKEEHADESLPAFQRLAQELGVWLSIGSMAMKSGDSDGRFANRSFLIGPDGKIAGRYDKIHMFDVQVSETETFRESAGYRPGETAVVCKTPVGAVGMSICYDVRFPHLYRALASAGVEILIVPSAFSPVTGAAHWEPLLRARAIETGCYVLAAAQTGSHAHSSGKQRKTWGHSLVISPWGEVLADAGTEPCMVSVDLDLLEVAKARQRVPSLEHDRWFEGP